MTPEEYVADDLRRLDNEILFAQRAADDAEFNQRVARDRVGRLLSLRLGKSIGGSGTWESRGSTLLLFPHGRPLSFWLKAEAQLYTGGRQEWHLSLIESSRRKNDVLVSSVREHTPRAALRRMVDYPKLGHPKAWAWARDVLVNAVAWDARMAEMAASSGILRWAEGL